MKELKWRFGVVGNIIFQHTDENGSTYYGTKAFTPNTKVYIDGKCWDHERNEISVIGRNRFGRIVVDTIPIDLIDNIRSQRIYKPHVLEIMDYLLIMEGWEWWGRTVDDRRDTEKFVKEINSRKQR